MLQKQKAILKNEKGSLTIDFLFSFILVMGICGILFAISLSLTVVEVSQYIAFASSRVYFAGHFNESTQESLAEQKFTQLTQQTPWRNLFKRDGWFGIEYIGTGDFRDRYPNVIGENDNDKFWGSIVELEAKVLDFNVPFFGSTNPDADKFTANLNSFIGREPTSSECVDFVSQRFEGILSLDSKYRSQINTLDEYARIYDNGC